MHFKNLRLSQFTKTLLLAGFLTFNNGCSGCVSQVFFSIPDLTSRAPANAPANTPATPLPSEAVTVGREFDFLTSIPSSSIWLVTTSNHVYNQSLLQNPDGTFPAPKKWDFINSSGGGARTYVTPAGLFFAKVPGKLYRVDADTPTNLALQPLWTAPSGKDRACVNSYVVNGTSYVGIAWNKGNGHRAFTQFPINMALPDKIDITQEKTVEYVSDTDVLWGYSCFTDQARNYFWSNRHNTIRGIDLTDLSEIPASKMPNAGHQVTGMGEDYLDPSVPGGNYPYAFSGDKNGNLLRGKEIYTFAQSPVWDVVVATKTSAMKISASSTACFFSLSDCSDPKQHSDFSLTSADGLYSAVGIGPMSTLSDGRIVGLARNGGWGSGGNTGMASHVYLLSLVNPNDITKGVSILHVAELPGEDTYMYTDFTGATLYPLPIDSIYDVRQFIGHNPSRHAISASFSWTSADGGNNPWQNLLFEAKCFSGPSAPPDLETVTGIQPSGGAVTPLNVPSCQAGTFDHIRVKVSSNSATSSNFSRAVKIQIQVAETP